MKIDFSQMITAEAKAARLATEIKARYTVAIEAMVTETAQAGGYSSPESLASYVASTNPVWADEAQRFVAWRDAVWAYGLEVLAAVDAGEKALPDIEVLLKNAPKP